MAKIDLEILIRKLDLDTRQILEQAIGNAVSRGNFDVEVEHLVFSLIISKNEDLKDIMNMFDMKQARLQKDLLNHIEKFRTGNVRTPGLSLDVVDLLQNSWVDASLLFHFDQISISVMLYALIKNEDNFDPFTNLSEEFLKIKLDRLADFINKSQMVENAEEQNTKKRSSSLDKFATNITELARQNKIDPIIGRSSEIRQVIDILSRRRQNNPILTGEAGVGKTAVVEGLALRIAKGDIPPILKNVEIHALDLAALQAGASLKGEFEKRLKSVIKEVRGSEKPIILFIDEAHNLVGTGNQTSQGDAANLLKPALARGELKTIAATTWDEYKRYFETDSALTRRFQVVKVDEPDEKEAIDMMRGLVSTLEKHHSVLILDEALISAVRLSVRYIPSRHLPDKAISLLDTAAARVNISQTSTPALVDDLEKELKNINLNIQYLNREQSTGIDHEEKIESLKKEQIRIEKHLKSERTVWAKEREVVKNIALLRKKLEKSFNEVDQSSLKALQEELERLQEKNPLIYDCVNSQIIAGVVSDWTGVPLGRMLRDETNSVLNIDENLKKRILGQDDALEIIAKQLKIASANLQDPNKPRGVFLLLGNSGVGKTETAHVLANLLYGGEQNLTVINMSEFKEAHKMSMLAGSPPGYVGYGKGGVLTETVRRRPYGIVLLDEMEKAHPSIQEAFYQVFDKGFMMDGEGRKIDFKNTLILMTSNAFFIGFVNFNNLKTSCKSAICFKIPFVFIPRRSGYSFQFSTS